MSIPPSVEIDLRWAIRERIHLQRIGISRRWLTISPALPSPLRGTQGRSMLKIQVCSLSLVRNVGMRTLLRGKYPFRLVRRFY